MLREALKHLDAFIAEADTVNILMVSDAEQDGGTDVSFEVQRLDMGQKLADRFREIVQTNVMGDVGNVRVVPYSTGYKLDRQELFYLDLDEDEATAETLDFIESVTEPEIFTKDDGFASRMSFYSIVLEGAGGTRAAFHRRHEPKNQLSRGIVARLVDQHHFEELESRIYLFDEKVDFFTWGGYAFIRGAYNFRLIFRHFEKLRQEVTQNVERVVASVPVLNEGAFLEACQNQPQMVSKVARVAKQPYLEDVTMEDIKRTIEAFDLDLQICTIDGEEKLVFDPSLKCRWLILKMLDDDFLGSIMTERKYETNSKIVRPAG